MLNLTTLANPVLSRDEARNSLKRHYRIFKTAMDDGMRELRECPQRHLLDARAEASVLNSAIVQKAIAAISAIAGEDDLKAVRGGNSCFFYIGAEIRSRFKKLTSTKIYKNLQTERQLMLMQQQQNIQGILSGTYLTLGYMLDPLRQYIQHHLITLQIGKTVYYEIDIDQELAGMASSVTTMPIIQAPTTSTRKRVRARVQPADQKPKVKGASAGQE